MTAIANCRRASPQGRAFRSCPLRCHRWACGLLRLDRITGPLRSLVPAICAGRRRHYPTPQPMGSAWSLRRSSSGNRYTLVGDPHSWAGLPRRPVVRVAGQGSPGDQWCARLRTSIASPRRHLLNRRHHRTGETALCCCYLNAADR